ncbi:ABC transporter substrate-binding protein [Arsukibacterium sp.]|uniref:ABC transporter substrate-binding protein n=1 Tax=Arsukibacterium sp. TaxID=1977258 RepID=UPI002FDB8A32
MPQTCHKLLLLYFTTFLSVAVMANTTTEPVKLGMSAPFSGPAAELGVDYRRGADLVFTQLNQRGGINGRQIQLLSLDDAYIAAQTINNTQSLLQQQVFALFGYVGTPGVEAVLPILRQNRTPFLAAFTGAEQLAHPNHEFIINLRASYQQEAEAQIRYFVDEQNLTRFVILVPADELDTGIEYGFSQALQQRKLQPLLVRRYLLNQADIEQTIATIKPLQPQVVIIAGSYQQVAKMINTAVNQEFMPAFSTLSFAGISALQQHLKHFVQVYASMVVPDPSNNQHHLVAQYQQHSLQSGVNQFSDVSLEGYLAAIAISTALDQCRLNLQHSCLLRQLRPLNLLQQSDGSRPVFMVQVSQRQLKPLN